jgi:serine/threonine protein kinase
MVFFIMKIIGEHMCAGFHYTILIVKRTPSKEVAIKRLNMRGRQGEKEFLGEVLILGKLDHPNLAKLLGCFDQNK